MIGRPRFPVGADAAARVARVARRRISMGAGVAPTRGLRGAEGGVTSGRSPGRARGGIAGGSGRSNAADGGGEPAPARGGVRPGVARPAGYLPGASRPGLSLPGDGRPGPTGDTGPWLTVAPHVGACGCVEPAAGRVVRAEVADGAPRGRPRTRRACSAWCRSSGSEGRRSLTRCLRSPSAPRTSRGYSSRIASAGMCRRCTCGSAPGTQRAIVGTRSYGPNISRGSRRESATVVSSGCAAYAGYIAYRSSTWS